MINDLPKDHRVRVSKVTQSEIRILLGLEHLIRQRWAIYDYDALRIVRRLLAGAPVEKGEHIAEVRRLCRGGQCLAELIVDHRRALPPIRSRIR